MFDTYYGVHRTNKFIEIFPDKDSFLNAYNEVGLGGFENQQTLNNLWVLLYARRGNDPIFASDQQRFVYNLFSIVYRYGGEFEKKVELQNKIRGLTEEELKKGTTSIYNFAENPSTNPSSQDFEQLTKINSQTATGYKKSRLESLLLQMDALDTSFIETFLKRFDKLFSPFPAEKPLLYDIEGVICDADD